MSAWSRIHVRKLRAKAISRQLVTDASDDGVGGLLIDKASGGTVQEVALPLPGHLYGESSLVRELAAVRMVSGLTSSFGAASRC